MFFFIFQFSAHMFFIVFVFVPSIVEAVTVCVCGWCLSVCVGTGEQMKNT